MTHGAGTWEKVPHIPDEQAEEERLQPDTSSANTRKCALSKIEGAALHILRKDTERYGLGFSLAMWTRNGSCKTARSARPMEDEAVTGLLQQLLC